MCGLLAYRHASPVAGVPFDEVEVLAALRRRGPDGQGALHLPHCSLIHTRLAILDPEHGRQPMVHDPSGVAIAYNGEVYNAPEIRQGLEARGHRFRTTADTEVVLAAFVEFGASCAAMFEGMFAYAIWDPRDRSLHVARDRLGEKPLFLARLPSGAVLVGSEIKALLAAGVEASLDRVSLDHYLQWKHMAPDRSIFERIDVVPPAHTMAFRDDGVTSDRYWTLPPSGHQHWSNEDAIDRLHELIDGSVRRRLRSDRDLGIFLSGGIDSTLVGALAARHSGKRLSGFSAAYVGELDESERAAASAERFGIVHHAEPVRDFTPKDVEAVCRYLDQPHADSANLAQARLSELASKHVPVVLTGDGADELFGGYRWYAKPTSLRDRMETMTIFQADRRQRLLGGGLPEVIDAAKDERDFDAVNRFDISHYLGGQLLPKADMLGMMHGIELRAPFLDYKLVEFARGLAPELKTGPEGKPLLRALLRRILPDWQPPQRKQGFGAPILGFVKEPAFNAYLRDRLGAGARIRTILDPTGLDHEIESAFSDSRRADAYRIWTLLCLELWADYWLPEG